MAVVVPIISTFDARGVTKAISDFKKLDGAGQRTQFAFGTTNKAISALGAQFAKFGAITAGVAGVVGGTLVKAAYESQKVMKQTEAIIKATGGAAGLSAKQVADFSEQLSMKTGIDDEAIQSSMNLLLTFKQVRNEVGLGNDIFNRASVAMLDLGNVFGSTDAAAKMLGKALSDPVKGVTALARAGVNFSQQQRDQIKAMVAAGNVLGAQKLILAEVESQVGGTAAATATGFDRMRVAFGNAAEDLGNLLIPYVERFADFITTNVVPKVQQFADIVGRNGLGAGLKFLGDGILTAIGNMGAFGNTVLALTAAFVALRGIMLAATVAQVAFNVALFANPIGIAVAAVIAFVTAMGALALKFKVVRDVFKEVWNGIVTYLQFQINIALGIVEFFVNNFINVANLLIRAWNKIPFTSKVDELKNVNLQLDITKAKVGQVGDAASKAGAKWREFEGFNAGKKTPSLSIGGGAGTGAGGTAKTVETLSDKFKKFADAARTLTSNQKSLRDALKNTASAQKQLQAATDKVTAAQEKLNRIAKGYGAGSKEAADAQKALTDAQRDAARAGFDVEKSNYAVLDAEKELQDARESGDPRKIREAEIALEEAKLAQIEANDRLAEANKNVEDAQKTLNETINGASTESQTYKDALAELKTAQEEQLTAIDNVREAKERELEVTRNLAKAELILLKAKKKLSSNQLGEADALLAELGSIPTVTVPTAPSTSSDGFDFSNIDWASIIGGIDVGGIGTFGFAKGGIVTKPVMGLIGEAGESEAVIPLSRMNEFVDGGSGITVNVTAGVGDPIEIGRQVVVALQAYQRRSGSIPIKVG